MSDPILVLNAGSSSVKFQLLQDKAVLVKGGVSGLGGGEPVLRIEIEGSEETPKPLRIRTSPKESIHIVMEWLEANVKTPIRAVGHRIVHGGTLFTAPVRITPEIRETLTSLVALAPMHQPLNLAAVDIVTAAMPGVPQVACFDTSFHSGHTPLFSYYALPDQMLNHGIRRYGFHGLSYEWIVYTLLHTYPELSAGRVVVAHLGSGSSVCAIDAGKSIDTTMGMTALDGLPMSTRCGQLDPGAVLYMMNELGMQVDAIENMLYEESGLKGLSGISGDMQTLMHSDQPGAHFALEYFALRTAQFMATMAASLGGVDAFIFTGGIGENAPALRENILGRLSFLGDIRTLVIPTNEERIIAMHTESLLAQNKDELS